MTPVLRALAAERLKLRGTLAWRLCFIAPALVVTVCVLQILVGGKASAMADGAQAWQRFSQGVLVLWAFLMLPLYVTLQSALLAGLEHNDRQWKHLLALPLPRSAHYLAKWWTLLALVLIATVVLVLLISVGGGLIMQLGNPLGLSGVPPWEFLLTRAAAIFGASILIISLHAWISIRFSSFTIAVATGMSATVAGFLIAQSARFGHWYPWSMPTQVLAGDGERIGLVVLTGLVGGVVFLAIGLFDFLRRDPI